MQTKPSTPPAMSDEQSGARAIELISQKWVWMLQRSFPVVISQKYTLPFVVPTARKRPDGVPVMHETCSGRIILVKG